MTLSRRDVLGLAAGMVAASTLPSHAALRSFGGHAFASTWRITGTDLDVRRLRPAIEAVIAQVDAQMSPWRSDSAISRFNTGTETDWQAMPQETCKVVSESLDVAALSYGAFDPTIGPAVARFGFGPINGGSGRYQDIAVGPQGVRKLQTDLTLDLCGIAKGYALDEIIAVLVRAGVQHALVELGGEIATIGQHPTGRDWQIAIEAPGASRALAQRVVTPQGLALATSGPLPNGYRGRVSLSHLIDPATARPMSGSLASVSVLANTAMRADALATALAAKGSEDGFALAQRLGARAFFLTFSDDPDQPLTERMTGGFATHLVA